MTGQLSPPGSGGRPARTANATRNGARPMPKHGILLIDDNRAWSEAVAEILNGEGFDVETAEDGQQGLELLDRCTPALVILDAHMPRLGGLAVLRDLRQRGQKVPVIVVSAEDESSLMAQALADGASSFLRKPVTPELLLRAIRRLIRRPDQDVFP
jgi:DNA-binding response OmpR family regulator